MSAINSALEVAADLCRKFEGLRLTPYICPAGYPTIGYGTVWKPDGTKVKISDPPITKDIAERWLTDELYKTYLTGILKVSPSLINHPLALGAMTDFAYNLGVARYRSSTLSKRINSGDFVGASGELRKWVRGGGRVLPGLVRRRAAEAALLPTL